MLDNSKKILFFLIFVLILFFSGFTFTQAKSYKYYKYESIIVKIQINPDSTLDVEERQVFNYHGNFHQAWRNIPLKGMSAISDIQVIDGETGMPLIYSSKKLDSLNPLSWGKFTYYRQNNQQIIEWYYDLEDTTKEWVIKYKVHGAIGFYKDHDEIYWNLFTDYEAPVEKTEAWVKIPNNTFPLEDFNLRLYANQSGGIAKIIDNRTFYFGLENIAPRQPVTIVVGWPKGLISQTEWWKDFFRIYWGYLLSWLIVFLVILIGFVYWYFTEKRPKGRGTIIPQYEPPQNLRPAMAEIICKETITSKAWPATIVDLAVRGYLVIKEEEMNLLEKLSEKIFNVFSKIIAPFLLINLLLSFYFFFRNSQDLGLKSFAFVLTFYFIILLVKLIKTKSFFRDYVVEKVKDFEEDPNLEDYEREFLRGLFGIAGNNYFSTKEIKRNPMRKEQLYDFIEKLTQKLYQEVELDTGVFEKKLSKEKYKNFLLSILVILFIFFLYKSTSFSQINFLIILTLISLAGLFIFIKFEARLSLTGRILKEDWLGFKMYLETAEKYRLQNLTPELFEKFLPYAMIFGIEKKWARAFEVLNIPVNPPTWYSGKYTGTSFSPLHFSTSFSSSFISAFSQSGGGGVGGGHAGGGAGGGGGGAR